MLRAFHHSEIPIAPDGEVDLARPRRVVWIRDVIVPRHGGFRPFQKFVNAVDLLLNCLRIFHAYDCNRAKQKQLFLGRSGLAQISRDKASTYRRGGGGFFWAGFDTDQFSDKL